MINILKNQLDQRFEDRDWGCRGGGKAAEGLYLQEESLVEVRTELGLVAAR